MRVLGVVVVTASLALATAPAQSAITFFKLVGNAGIGLLPGNENVSVSGSPGTGGEVGGGIFYDDLSNKLTINIGWGKQNGFSDNLNGNATMGHIHGPTADPAPISFGQNAGVLIGLNTLAGWDPNPTKGGFIGFVTLDQSNETDLFAGKLYINIHTQLNDAGETRGNLVMAPEPGTWAMMLAGLAGLGWIARRRGR